MQYNDPDPWRWASFYGLAAACCAGYHLRKLHWQLSGLLCLFALGWCLYLLPQFVGEVSMEAVTASLSMRSRDVEEAREAGGALLVALWMAALSVQLRPGRGQ